MVCKYTEARILVASVVTVAKRGGTYLLLWMERGRLISQGGQGGL